MVVSCSRVSIVPRIHNSNANARVGGSLAVLIGLLFAAVGLLIVPCFRPWVVWSTSSSSFGQARLVALPGVNLVGKRPAAISSGLGSSKWCWDITNFAAFVFANATA